MSRYKDRPRDTEYMLWIKQHRCCALLISEHVGPCEGAVEADHAGGGSGMGRKANDATCIPLCVRHHRLPGLGHILYGKVPHGFVREWKRTMADLFRRKWLEQRTVKPCNNDHANCDCMACRPRTS